ncbi:hypothetical protein BC828DRAFT_83774 [Blastocladiella britannica]|nr:hypothetical protein BC828DRAFT_83774 [Blastocladiella britannica]
MTVTTTTTPTNHDRIPSPSPSMQKEPFVVVNEDTPSPASAGPPPPSRQPAISWTHLSMPSSPPHHTSSVVPPPQPDQQQQQLSASLCADVDMVHLTESVVRSDLSNGVPATRAVPRHPGGGGPVLPPPRQSSGEFDNASSSSARHIRHQKTPSQHGKATDTAMDFEVLSPPRSSNMPIAAQRSTGMPAPSSRGSRSPSISSFSSSGSSPFFASSHPPGRSAHNGGGMMLLGTSDTEEDDDFDHHHHDHHDDEDDDRQRRRRLSHQKHEDMDDSTTLSDSHVIVECGGPGTDEVFQLETEGEFRFIESVPMPPRPAPLLAHSPSSAPLPPPPSSASESGRAVTSTSTVRRKSLLLSAAASRHQSEKTALALLTRWSTFPWFTYRTSIAHWLVRADTGWGCMHRTGQMLLARALLVARFGHVLSPALYKKDEPAYTRILGLFADPQSPKHQGGPWSLPRICEAGAVEGAPIGAWYSPTTVARALARIGNVPEVKARSNAVLHVAGDATVVQDAVALSARDPTSSVSWTPVVLLIPVRLGLDRIGAGHVKRLLQVFQWPQFIGCAGTPACSSAALGPANPRH